MPYYLDKLKACDTRAAFDALLMEIFPYSLELERQDKSEWWVIEHAFEVKSDWLQQATQRKHRTEDLFGVG